MSSIMCKEGLTVLTVEHQLNEGTKSLSTVFEHILSICQSNMSLAEIRTQASKLFRSRFMQMKIIANISFLFCFPVELLIIIYKQNFVHL